MGERLFWAHSTWLVTRVVEHCFKFLIERMLDFMSVANFRKEKHRVLMSAAYSSIFLIILSYRSSIP